MTAGGEVEENYLDTQNNTMNHLNSHLLQCQRINESSVKQTFIVFIITHIPGANKHRDHIRFTQLRMPGFHQLKKLAESVTFLQGMRATW